MPRTILVADDSPTIHRVIELSFAGEPFRLVCVSNGAAALDAIRRAAPDVVLADVELPGTDGYEIARFVKNEPDRARIPVVLLAGAFEPVDEARAAAVRCDSVVSKPFEPQALVALVHALLDRDRPRGPEPPELEDEAPLAASSPSGAGARRSDQEVFDTLERAFADAGLSDDPGDEAPAASPAAAKAAGGHVAPRTAEAAPGSEAAAVAETTVAGTATATVRAPAMLTAAFTTLLACERGRPLTDTASERDATARDALVEEVSRRVVERLMPAGDVQGADRRLSEIVRRVVREELGRQDG